MSMHFVFIETETVTETNIKLKVAIGQDFIRMSESKYVARTCFKIPKLLVIKSI